MAIGLIIYHFRTQKGMLLCKESANIMWCIHYIMIGAWSALGTGLVCVAREIIYAYDKNEKRRKIFLVVFILLCFISAYFTWQNISSILPAVATSIATYSFFQKNVTVTRLLALVTSILLIIYHGIVGSVGGVISDASTLISVSVALFRFKSISGAQ